jgi:hypothetical protein
MCEVIVDETYGQKVEIWERAKLEAVRAIVREGRNRRSPISYSDLAKQIASIRFCL